MAGTAKNAKAKTIAMTKHDFMAVPSSILRQVLIGLYHKMRGPARGGSVPDSVFAMDEAGRETLRGLRPRQLLKGGLHRLPADSVSHTSNSATTGAWSEGFSPRRSSRSIQQSLDFSARGFVAQMWSMRQPSLFFTAFRTW